MLSRLLVVLALIPAVASAQSSAPPPPATQEKPSGTPFTAGWRDGFFIQNETGDFRLQIGALVQGDGRFALDGRRCASACISGSSCMSVLMSRTAP
jgi:hypothetical protein